MAKIATTAEKRKLPTPSAKPLAHFDKVRAWIKRPLTDSERQRLARECYGSCPPQRDPPRCFGAPGQRIRYNELVELNQPSERALRMLAALGPCKIESVEVTLNYICRTAAGARQLHEFFASNGVLRYDRDRFYLNEAFACEYSGLPGKPKCYARYSDRPCKITQNQHCFHHEFRLKGKALSRAHIHTLYDLINFDHYLFWRKHIRLFEVDTGRLGMVLSGGKRRKPTIADHHRGERILAQYSSVGDLVWRFRREASIRSALRPIDIEPWLPQPEHPLSIHGSKGTLLFIFYHSLQHIKQIVPFRSPQSVPFDIRMISLPARPSK